MWIRTVFLLLCCTLPFGGAYAGALDDFEEEATKKAPAPTPPPDNGDDDRPAPRRGGHSGGGYYSGSGFGGGYSRGGNYAVDNSGNVYRRECDLHYGITFYGCPWRWVGYASLYRVSPPSEAGESWTPTPREKGEWVLPFLRLEVGYQTVENNDNLDALESLVELGYGPFAFVHQQNYFREDIVDDPSTPVVESGKDTLRLSTNHLLFRLSSNRHYEVSLGAGQMRLAGNDSNRGFSVVVPFRLVNDDGLGVSAQLGWGWPGEQSISNHQASVVYTQGAFSIHGGYRWFDIQGSRLNLNGPILKLGFHY
jgi:hypothetical protein